MRSAPISEIRITESPSLLRRFLQRILASLGGYGAGNISAHVLNWA